MLDGFCPRCGNGDPRSVATSVRIDLRNRDSDVARLRRTFAYGYIRDNVPAAAIKTLLFSLGYVFLLIAGLVIVNIVLARLTREEREAERQRRRQRKTS